MDLPEPAGDARHRRYFGCDFLAARAAALASALTECSDNCVDERHLNREEVDVQESRRTQSLSLGNHHHHQHTSRLTLALMKASWRSSSRISCAASTTTQGIRVENTWRIVSWLSLLTHQHTLIILAFAVVAVTLNASGPLKRYPTLDT
jgi:hypothetical protein